MFLTFPFGPATLYVRRHWRRGPLVSGWGVDGVTVFQKGFPLVFTNGNPNYGHEFGGGSRLPIMLLAGSKGAQRSGLSNSS